MKQLLKFMFFLVLITSCSDPKPKAVYDSSIDTTDNQIAIDTTALVVAGLPIHFDSTKFLIHPIGQYIPEKRGVKIYQGSFNSNSSGLTVAYRSDYSVSGDMDNLKFQHIDSINFVPLTENQIKIRSFTFLRSIFKSSKKQVLVYSVTDRDSNKDGILDDRNIVSLYISALDGRKFKKLSPELQELVDWQVMDIQERIYFITSEDIDRNGEFDKLDQLHYYYFDLKLEGQQVIEYDPIDK